MALCKPPLGVMPKQFYDTHRLEDLKRAIEAYLREKRVINLEWIVEYNQLVAIYANPDPLLYYKETTEDEECANENLYYNP